MGSNVAEPNTTELREDSRAHVASKALFGVLAAVSVCHLLNDMVQSLIPAIYPILKSNFKLNFGQIGLISFTYQLVACLLQPFVGLYTDKRPKPYSLVAGMGFTLIGLIMLASANTFMVLIVASAFVGMGSSIFHPESSRVARLASGGQHGLAQSLFQVGGNAGSALGPLLAAYLVVPHGQRSMAWCSLATLLGMVILTKIGSWYKRSGHHLPSRVRRMVFERPMISSSKVAFSIAILIALIFSKYFYLASLTSYYTFYLISKFHVTVKSAQLLLFLFLGAAAVGTVVGGPIGDRFGRKLVIWCSILGVLPFTLILPYVNLFWTAVLTVIIGLVIASAFTAILVYAQELMPGKVGMVSGLFFGFAFGMGGVGAAVLGKIADATSITFVYHVCAFLPAIGILTVFLPNIEKKKPRVALS